MGNFIVAFKKAEVCPLYKNDGRADKSNYRPISILSVSIQNTNVAFVKVSVLSISVLSWKKWKFYVVTENFCAVILADLSKTFDNIFHDLLILKLTGFDRNALKLIYGYFSDRSQKPKVGSFFSACLDIIYDLPQGSILESLMSNTDLCDLFF